MNIETLEKLMWIAYSCFAIAALWSLILNLKAKMIIEKKNEKILILEKHIEQLESENKGCVVSLKTCEVMLRGY